MAVLEGSRPAASVPAVLLAHLPDAIERLQARQLPARDESLIARLSKLQGMLDPLLNRGDGDDRGAIWQVAAATELRKLPGDLVLEGLDDAAQKVRRLGDVVPHVFAYVEDIPARRKAQIEKLLALRAALENEIPPARGRRVGDGHGRPEER